MSKGQKKYKYRSLADFIQAAWNGNVPQEDVEKVIEQIRQGVGLAKRDRELAKFMEAAPSDVESDPIYQAGYVQGYRQCRRDVQNGCILDDNGNAQGDIGPAPDGEEN